MEACAPNGRADINGAFRPCEPADYASLLPKGHSFSADS
jgi:hypothetical protein